MSGLVSAQRSALRLTPAGLTTLLCCALVPLVVISLSIGPAHLSMTEILQGLSAPDTVAGIIVREIRLPRLLLSLSVGATLGLCGAALQGLLRNPLAEPAIFGAPQAAAFGAAAVLYLGFADAFSFALPLAAMAGAGLSIALVVMVAGRGAHLVTLILAGLAIGTLAGAATSLVINLSANPFAVTEIVFWLMGSFEDRSLRHVIMSAPFLAISAAMLLYAGHGYRALTLGEDVAATLGVNVERLRLLTIVGVSIGVGASVAVSGAIGFVGLVAPHLVRPLVGGDPQRTLIPSALVGAVLLTAADIGVRLIPATSEIRIGVLTAAMGVPLFLWLVITQRAYFTGAA
jgi:iron complex transport system permease protein